VSLARPTFVQPRKIYDGVGHGIQRQSAKIWPKPNKLWTNWPSNMHGLPACKQQLQKIFKQATYPSTMDKL
jgi:hypothetical protein